MNPTPSYLLKKLRQSPVFQNLPEDQLRWLVSSAEFLELKEGEFLFRQGDPVDRMVILLKGRLSYQQEQNGSTRTIDYVEAGELSGALPYSRAKAAITQAKALEDIEALCLHQKHFREMIRDRHELTETLVHSMTSRVREFTRIQQQLDKMAALGKLSAGLAHELNNPAAAVARSSAKLKEYYSSLPALLEKVLKSQISPAILDYLQSLISRKTSAGTTSSIGLLERTSQEDEQASWLKKHGITKPYPLAETFAQFEISISELEELNNKLSTEQLIPILNWLHQLLVLQKLAEEIQSASGRMSELVGAVKTYSQMDQSSDKKEADIRQGIGDTLKILNFKLKSKNIHLHTHFQENLPKVCAYAAELNQLWTNLIDNAIDAMEKGGELVISAAREDKNLKVSIADNGKGISKEEKKQIFDPFFTTKPLGKGSGLGLDIARRIIEHHEGELKLESKPGKTVFTVYIPL